MQIREYSSSGRTLMIEFRCKRCKTTKIERLEDVIKRSSDHYDFLSNMKEPKGWSCNGWGWLLCPECTEALKNFMEEKRGTDNEM